VTRSTTSAQECLSPVNPTKFPRRSIRTNGPITCCDFGLDRVQKFQNVDFCPPCKMWDDRDVIASRQASRTSKQYKCVRIHQSLSSPQWKDSKWWLLHCKEQSDVAVSVQPSTVLPGALPGPSSAKPDKPKQRKIGLKVSFWKRMYNIQKISAKEKGRLHAIIERLEVKLDSASKAKAKFYTDLKKCQWMLKKVQQRNNRLVLKKKQNKPTCIKVGIQSSLDDLIA
jgi:hypothetical protein